jgi:hypothetical protein
MSKIAYLNKISAGSAALVEALRAAALRVSIKDSADGVRLQVYGTDPVARVSINFHPSMVQAYDLRGWSRTIPKEDLDDNAVRAIAARVGVAIPYPRVAVAAP